MKPETRKWIKLVELEIFENAEPMDIDELACGFFGIDKKWLFSKCRMRPIPFARFIVWRIRNVYFSQSLQFLAKKYNKKDHTTILHGKNKALTLPEYRKFLNYLIKKHDSETID
jgi:chromosomal replication initiation ATPase DnaA